MKKYMVVILSLTMLVLTSCQKYGENKVNPWGASYSLDSEEEQVKNEEYDNLTIKQRADIIEYIYGRYEYYDSQESKPTGDKYSDTIWEEASEEFGLSESTISLVWVDAEAISYYDIYKKAKSMAETAYDIAKENNYPPLHSGTDLGFELACEAAKTILQKQLGSSSFFLEPEECWAVFKIEDLYNVYGAVYSNQNGWQRFVSYFEMSADGQITVSYGADLLDKPNPDQQQNSTDDDFKNVTDEDEFWAACAAAEKVVKQSLKAPSSAKFSSSKSDWAVRKKGNSYVVQSYVEAKNALGGELKETFTATFTLDSKGKISDYSVTF